MGKAAGARENHWTPLLTNKWGIGYLHWLLGSDSWTIPRDPADARELFNSLDRSEKRDLLHLLNECERRMASDPRYPFVFFRRYLGHWHNCDPGPHHVDIVETCVEMLMCETPQRYPHAQDAAAWAVPRGHGKTTSMISLLLWVVLIWEQFVLFQTFDRPYVYMFGKRAGQAQSNLRKIKSQIERNPLLREDFGVQVGPMWRNDFLKLRNGAIVAAAGVGQAIRGALEDGQRPNVLLFDDVDDEQALLTEESRLKTMDWLDKVALALGIPGESVAWTIGTVIHPNSMLANLVDRDERPGWGGRVYAALTEGHNPRETGARALWPAKMPVKALRKAYARTSVRGWASEYMNNPVSDDTTLFRQAWLDDAMTKGRHLPMLDGPPPRDVDGSWVQFEIVAQSFDLAFVDDPKKAAIQKSAWNVGITWGVDHVGNLHVLHIARARGLNPTQLDDWLMLCAYTHEPDVQIIEDNHAGHVHIHTVVENTDIPVIRHNTNKNKRHNVEGIPGLQRPFEDGKIILYCGDDRSRKLALSLCAELHRYPAKPDDQVMAFWIGWFRLRRLFKRLRKLKARAAKRAQLMEEVKKLRADRSRR